MLYSTGESMLADGDGQDSKDDEKTEAFAD
jgi:hypothetical protein